MEVIIGMERTVTQVRFRKPPVMRLKRVAAYSRVSSGKDAMLHSLSAQISYYSELIQHHPGWVYCGVFSDEAMTGTKASRPGFQALLKECRAGNIDLIITKSISRFARNTVTLLETVRELKERDIDVYFEEQRLHTIGPDGELIMTILAAYAQEESLSVSENQKWRVKKNFEDGKPWDGTLIGYRYVDGKYVVQPEGAETTYLAGLYRFEEHRGVQIPVFAVLTRESVAPVSIIHNRMPVILGKENLKEWVRPDGDPRSIAERALTNMVMEKAKDYPEPIPAFMQIQTGSSS